MVQSQFRCMHEVLQEAVTSHGPEVNLESLHAF